MVEIKKVRKITILGVIFLLGIFSFPAMAGEKEAAEGLERARKISKIERNEAVIQKKINAIDAAIEKKFLAEKLTDADFAAVENLEKEKEKYAKQLRRLKKERGKLEDEDRDPAAWMRERQKKLDDELKKLGQYEKVQKWLK